MPIHSRNNSNAANTWVSFAIMFIAGLAGGAVAITFFSSHSNQSRASAAANLPVDQLLAAAPQTESPSPSTATVDTSTLDELRTLKSEVEQLRAESHASGVANSSQPTNAPSQNPPREAVNASPSMGQRTLAYWNEMNSIMSREAAMRAAPPQLTAENALSFVNGQSSAFEFASSAFEQLNTDGVDPQAVALGREITAWYKQGITTSQTAESLLGSSDIAARQGSAGQSWSTSEKQHREACLAINSRGEQLRQQLSRKYGLQFPPLQ